MKHYEHMRDEIERFFKTKGFEIALEPSGSRGPDIVGINMPLVGEVKHERELCRDLHCAFWTNWNSTKQKFGGKTLDYRLADNVPDEAESLSDRAKGWVAVIYGQLKYMAIDAGVAEAWIVYENYYSFESSLVEASGFLSQHNLILADLPEHEANVGFMKITFMN